MKKIIRKAYLNLLENIKAEKSEQQCYWEQEEDKFYDKLDENQKKLFIELSEIDTGKIAEAELAYFKEGFKLGLLLTSELMLN